ncbi:DUF5362 family protein [Rossellomorea marisflavi]|uniref:DUF5362 family protein n=1 Tax=Rossellomorea marisflavi TaxID=189381 RepID=UPI003F9FFA2D
MITGIINALVGAIFGVIIGAIPGLVSVWLGYIIYKSGVEASEFLKDQKEERVEGILELYGKFLKVQGILLIVGLLLMIPFFLLGLASVAFFG